MRCHNCNKKLLQTAVTNVWYHKKSNSMYCDKPHVATPKTKKK